MQVAMTRHGEMLRGATEAHGGYVFKAVSGAFCAAFSTAPPALLRGWERGGISKGRGKRSYLRKSLDG
jgi:hypothetical protein